MDSHESRRESLFADRQRRHSQVQQADEVQLRFIFPGLESKTDYLAVRLLACLSKEASKTSNSFMISFLPASVRPESRLFKSSSCTAMPSRSLWHLYPPPPVGSR